MLRTKKLWMIIAIGFILGVIITVSEPDLQVLAQQVLSARNNSLILRRTIIRGHRVCGVFFFCS